MEVAKSRQQKSNEGNSSRDKDAENEAHFSIVILKLMKLTFVVESGQ